MCRGLHARAWKLRDRQEQRQAQERNATQIQILSLQRDREMLIVELVSRETEFIPAQASSSLTNAMEKLGQELSKTKSELDNLMQQVKDWQKMYVKLSQAGSSDAGLEIQMLKNDNAKYKVTIDELKVDIQGLHGELELRKAERNVHQKLTLRVAADGQQANN